jgi:hypothetical protein
LKDEGDDVERNKGPVVKLRFEAGNGRIDMVDSRCEHVSDQGKDVIEALELTAGIKVRRWRRRRKLEQS